MQDLDPASELPKKMVLEKEKALMVNTGKHNRRLSDSIFDQVHDRSRPSPPLTKYSIFRVPERLRDGNVKAYEPHLIAIDPYYHHNESLKMEGHKKWYLEKLLERKGEKKEHFLRYVNAMRALENDARECYKDKFEQINSDEFVKMMLYDGCFIIELLRRFANVVQIDDSDPLISLGWINKKLVLDLLLLENQLPFIVVHTLFEMTRHDRENDPNFLIRTIIDLFVSSELPQLSPKVLFNPGTVPKHILGLIYHNLSSMAENCSNTGKLACGEKCYQGIKRNFSKSFSRKNSGFTALESQGSGSLDVENPKSISCATELREAGIKFKKAEADSLFHINFKNGVFEIPRLVITDEIESIFRNLIVYEQLFLLKRRICNYIKFMDCLINSSKDVRLLCRRNILHNCLGDHEVVATVFNRLGDFVTLSPDSDYSQIFERVNKHCERRRNKWIANLILRYFITPWTFMSVLAASLPLLLTLAQTLFSILAYYQKK